MILTGERIHQLWRQDRILIDPFDEKRLGPNSYDLTLSDQLAAYEVDYMDLDDFGWRPIRIDALDMKKENPSYKFSIGEEGIVLRPGEIYLASTVEKCGSDEFVCCLEGRSSVARLGISVHLTAGFGDLGWKNSWCLEMTCVRPVRIYAGVRICQAIFYETSGERTRLYEGKYADGGGPVVSRMWRDFVKEQI